MFCCSSTLPLTLKGPFLSLSLFVLPFSLLSLLTFFLFFSLSSSSLYSFYHPTRPLSIFLRNSISPISLYFLYPLSLSFFPSISFTHYLSLSFFLSFFLSFLLYLLFFPLSLFHYYPTALYVFLSIPFLLLLPLSLSFSLLLNLHSLGWVNNISKRRRLISYHLILHLSYVNSETLKPFLLRGSYDLDANPNNLGWWLTTFPSEPWIYF